jgi:hypothetical protein
MSRESWYTVYRLDRDADTIKGDIEMKYTLDTKQVKTLEQIEKMTAALIKSETGAETEVTIRQEIMVYTEKLDLVDAIKNLMSQAQEFISASFYEADEDIPAGVTLKFAL